MSCVVTLPLCTFGYATALVPPSGLPAALHRSPLLFRHSESRSRDPTAQQQSTSARRSRHARATLPLLHARRSGTLIPLLRPALPLLGSLAVVTALGPRAALASGGAALLAPVAGDADRSRLLVRLGLWLVLFVTAALLASAETALTTLWPWKVKQLAQQDADKGRSSPFEDLQSDITKVLTTVLIGVTFCTIFGTALATDVAVQLFGKRGVGLATLAVTAVTLFFGEILPKSLAVTKPESVARATLPLISVLGALLSPISWLTAGANKAFLALLGHKSEAATEGEVVTQPELRLILSGASQSGSVDGYEQDMIEGVLDLQRTQVSQIMTPRVELAAVEATSTLAQLLDVTEEYKYSRVPVYNKTVDEIIGVVRLGELFDYARAPESRRTRSSSREMVTSLMEPTDFVPESMSALAALKQMRRQRLHMLVVVDEYGGTSGIVTLEDILETMVGEIYDEDDEEEVAEDRTSIRRAADGTYLLDGTADLDAVCEALELELGADALAEFSTISGYLCSQAGEIPEAGDAVYTEGLRFDVLEADDRRILSLRAANSTEEERARAERRAQEEDAAEDAELR